MTTESGLPAFRLRPPPVRDALARPRITGRILATAPGEACLLCAAPGYGATTALVQAVSGSADQVRWVSVDTTVPDTQARALLAAAVGASEPGPVAALRALADRDSGWVVVDGVLPEAHPGLAGDVAALVRSGHPVRIAVAAHGELDLAGSRRLDEADLRFEPDEGYALVDGLAGDADVSDVAAVLAAAEGWATAIVAGALRIGTRDTPQWVRGQAPAELLAQWFAGQPPQRREFLERTAVLDLLGEGPAGAIVGDERARAVLRDLLRNHCYVLPAAAPDGHDGPWVRRHPLLTALLRQRGPASARAGHTAAARWFMGAGDVQSAMHHLVRGGEVALAASYLSQHESHLISTGHTERIAEWYDRLASADADRLTALLRVGWGQVLSGDVSGADASVERLRALLAARPEDTSDDGTDWEAEESLLRAYLAAFHADPATMVTAGEAARDETAGRRMRDAAQLAPLLVAQGLLWSGRPEPAAAVLREIADEPHPNATIREVRLGSLRALVDRELGDITRAAATVARTATWIRASGIDPVTFRIHLHLLAAAAVHLDLGDVDRAQQVAQAAVEGAQASGNHGEAAWGWILVAQAHMGRGDHGAALRALQHGREQAQASAHDSLLLVPVEQAQALVHIASGDPVRAERIIRQLPPSAPRSLLAARAGLTRQPVLSRRTLEAITSTAPRVEVDKHLLLACLLVRTSRSLAQGHLRKAAALARRYSLRQALIPGEPVLVELVDQSRDPDVAWLRGAVEAGGEQLPPQGPALSRGELQLLTLLPTRAKNTDIASTLGVSVNTVKTRLRRLYAKLGAANRDEAIERARERGLVARSPADL